MDDTIRDHLRSIQLENMDDEEIADVINNLSIDDILRLESFVSYFDKENSELNEDAALSREYLIKVIIQYKNEIIIQGIIE